MIDEELKVNHSECDCDCGCDHDDECDCGCEEDTVDLVDDQGRHLKFFHVGTTQFKEKAYAFFMPAEEIEGLGEDEVVIFEIGSNDGSDEQVLLPVEDEALLENVYEQFCREMDEEAEAAEAAELEGCGCGCGCEDEEDDDHDDDCGCGCHHHHN